MNDPRALAKVEHGIGELEKMGHYIATSGLFGVKSPVQAVALMLIAQAEGRHPASAAQDYNIIQNRPALKADSMLARFQQAGGKVEWDEYTDERVAGRFSHPQAPKPVLVDWDMARAQKAGLGAKDNWKHYPRAMLRARVISEGVRTVYPAVLGGMYTPEEVMDFEPTPAPTTTVETPMTTSVDPPDTTTATTAPTDNGTHEKRVQIGTMLMEICNNNTTEAEDMLEYMTAWTDKQGKAVAGRRSVKTLTEKQVPIVYRKVEDQHTKWLEVQDAPPPTEYDNSEELNEIQV